MPDEEIVEAISSCFDEQGDAADVAAMPADKLMSYSKAYVRAQDEERRAAYRIVDDDGRAYTFNPAEWDVEVLDKIGSEAYSPDPTWQVTHLGNEVARDVPPLDPVPWDTYDMAPGWDGEGWADDWND